MFVQLQGSGSGLTPEQAEFFGMGAPDVVRAYFGGMGGVAPTPLHFLSGLARAAGVGKLYVKDEGFCLGLGSFKALGGAYAVARLVQQWATEALRHPVTTAELYSPEVRAAVGARTVTCATDGNHGRSVAAGASRFGCKAVVFVHGHVNEERLAAIKSFGAEVRVVAGNYDDSVEECARIAAQSGWQVVSDTSWPGYEEIPRRVMQGYTVMIWEALAQMEAAGDRPTHIFIQGGVGGVAASCAAHVSFRYGHSSPKVIVVEPQRANCLLQSALARRPTRIPAMAPTVMGMLECYAPSPVAWAILQDFGAAFIDVADEEAVSAMNLLARPSAGDPPIVAGESGAAGIAGLLNAARTTEIRMALELSPKSSVLTVVTEGATAPSIYRRLVDMDSTAVDAGLR